jgi:N-methylhydantoinase B
LRENSGGAGQHRGGLGVRITYRVLVPCKVTINNERTRIPPWGVHGGGSAAHNISVIEPSKGEKRAVLKGTELPLDPGDRVVFDTAGGGGYGDPAKRDPKSVANDVTQGYISVDEAARDYGFGQQAAQ